MCEQKAVVGAQYLPVADIALIANMSPRNTSFRSPPTSPLPPGTWDSHIHIIDPINFPLDSGATYTTGVYNAWDNVLFESSIGAEHNVIVQPSIYGNNNDLLITSLKAFGPDRSRGIVAFNPAKTTQHTLEEWHKLGVRGVRVNLGFVNEEPSIEDLKVMLSEYAAAIRPFDWVIQLYIEMSWIAALEEFLPTLGVDIVFDHMGHPDIPDSVDRSSFDPYTIEGFGSLINLLKTGKVWTKISAAYRLSKACGPFYHDMDPLLREFFTLVPDQLVYASDWPHTLYEGLDIRPWTEHLIDLIGDDEDTKTKLFRDNAMRLWKTS